MERIDGDTHIFEPRGMWREHIDPARREDAIAIEDDELGYPWLTWRGERLHIVEVQRPYELQAIGDYRQRRKREEPAEASYEELLPAAYSDPGARERQLDEWGLDAAVLLPNFGLLFETQVGARDVGALTANLRAWNRWIAGVDADHERLLGVGHLSLRDADWAVDEIGRLAEAGIRAAMIAPQPVDGRRLSHPDLEPVWETFAGHGVAPIFHVGDFHPLPGPWYEPDPEPVNKLLDSTFLWFGPAVATTDLIVNGVLERHPDLRLGIIELTASWVPNHLLMMDGAWGFYAAQRGEPYADLPMAPSEYFRRQVRVGALAYEQPATLVEQAGEDVFMYGSDWPHAEGIAHPVASYEELLGPLPDSAREKLFAGNVRWLLGAA